MSIKGREATMKKYSIISILFILIASQLITQKVTAQSNYYDYSASQKTDIFVDHFNDNWHVWPYIRDGDTWTGKIENGTMLWESKGTSSISQEKVIPINENLDFEIETSIRYLRGQDTQSNSLDWGRNDDGHYYSFGFSGNGQYLICDYDGEWSYDVPWTPSDLVNKTSYNKLTVRKVGGSYYYFLNERLVGTSSFRPFWGQKMGFSISAGIAIQVDFLRVSYLNLGEESKYQYYTTRDRSDIFRDDFNDNVHGWPFLQDGETWAGRIEYGYMLWASKNDVRYNQERTITINESRDFEIETGIQYISGEDNNTNSLFWGRDEGGSCFYFGISGNGSYIIRKYDGGWADIIPWTATGLVKRKSFNTLTVRKVGHTAYFFLNESLVHVMAYQPFWGNILGFTVNSNTVMHIDFLRISYLEKGTQNLPPEIVITEPSVTRGVQIVSHKSIRVSGRALDSDGIYEVTANGIEALLQRDGSFSVDVPLAIGENMITVTATDIKMMSTSEVITIRRKSQVISDPANLTGEKRLALVIGNANYLYGGSLANPVNDARSIQRILESLGFTVLEYENCNQRTMKRAMDEFGQKLKTYDIGLFFYAGHGLQVNGSNYLIPIDAKLENENDVEYDCVRAGRILAKMESAGSSTNIVILDACRDNPFERGWRRGTQGNGLAFMNAPSGSLIAYATSPGSTAADGTGRNGLYTSALLEHIITPNITIEDVFKRVRTTVRLQSASKQIPWESTSLEGNFYFKK